MLQRQKRKIKASRWYWNPWYARLWWASAVMYWTAFAISFFDITPLARFYESTFAGYLNIVFYPPVILVLLGTGFVRAKIRQGDWIINFENAERNTQGHSTDPYTDPFDPRSGSLYVGSAESTSRVFGRPWP